MKSTQRFNKRLQCTALALAIILLPTVLICYAQNVIPANLGQLKYLVVETGWSPEGPSRIEMAKRISDTIRKMSPDQKRAIDDKLVDEIANLLADQNDGVRYYAAISLGNIGHRAARSLPSLRAALSRVSPTPANTIGPDLGSDAVIPLAIKKITDANP